jgi:2-polyprenyl-3-methyl-5-hydroxy-6-metoxy-1,4-benzoquinol methylase
MEKKIKKECASEFYDKVFSESKIFKKNPQEITEYYKSWSFAKNFILNNNIKLVIDIGCGPGNLAQLLEDLDITYIGIDFSKVGIDECNRKVNKKNFSFINDNAFNIDYFNLIKNYKNDEILFTSFEFLEHITNDIDIIKLLPQNIKFCFSLPNYDSESHIRYFDSVQSIKNRFEKYLDITHIIENVFDEPAKKKYKIFVFNGIIKNSL